MANAAAIALTAMSEIDVDAYEEENRSSQRPTEKNFDKQFSSLSSRSAQNPSNRDVIIEETYPEVAEQVPTGRRQTDVIEEEQEDEENLVTAKPVEEPELPSAVHWDQKKAEEATAERRRRANTMARNAAVLGLLLILIVGLSVGLTRRDSEVLVTPSPTVSASPSASPSAAPTTFEARILNLLPDDTLEALEDVDSAQYKAYQWLLEDETADGDYYSDMRLAQRFALATLYFASTPESWYKVSDGADWLSPGIHECEWAFTDNTTIVENVMFLDMFGNGYYPTPTSPCGNSSDPADPDERAYEQLWLPGANLRTNELPKEIFMLTSLRVLNLMANKDMKGTVPKELGSLTDLEALAFGATDLTGSLPSEVGLLTNLHSLVLFDNHFTGSLPTEIGSLENLNFVLMNYAGIGGPDRKSVV